MQHIGRDNLPLLNGSDNISYSIDKKDIYLNLMTCHDSSPLNLYYTEFNEQDLKHSSYLNYNESIRPQLYDQHHLEQTNFIPQNITNLITDSNVDLESWSNRNNRDNLSTDNDSSIRHQPESSILKNSNDFLLSHAIHNKTSFDYDKHPVNFSENNIIKSMSKNDNSIGKQYRIQDNTNKHKRLHGLQLTQNSGCSNLTKQQLIVKAHLMSSRKDQRKQTLENKQKFNRNDSTIQNNCLSSTKVKQHNCNIKKKSNASLKLQFHYQALPSEYLSHYEATQFRNHNNVVSSVSKTSVGQQKSTTLFSQSQKNKSTSCLRQPHENIKSWLKKIAEIQRNANKKLLTKNDVVNISSSTTNPKIKKKSRRLSSSCNKNLYSLVWKHKHHNNHAEKCKTQLNTKKNSNEVQCLTDVRHDDTESNNILNLDMPLEEKDQFINLPYMDEITLDNMKPRRGRKPKKTDICHLIYKSDTLSPVASNYQININDNNMMTHINANSSSESYQIDFDKPLNLCIRDLINDAYSISNDGIVNYTETSSSCSTPVTPVIPVTPVSTRFNILRDRTLSVNMKHYLKANLIDKKSKMNERLTQLNLITAYCQKLIENGTFVPHGQLNGHVETIQKDNQLALKIPIPNGLLNNKINEKSLSINGSSVVSNLNPENLAMPILLNQAFTNLDTTTTQKRKRSSLYIPPENTNTPANEVSICKFKFTGGAKPSLLEKKMLCVDADGNYRFFNGTNEKTSRNFEYYPRKYLQQMSDRSSDINCTLVQQQHSTDTQTTLTPYNLVNENELLNEQASNRIRIADYPIASAQITNSETSIDVMDSSLSDVTPNLPKSSRSRSQESLPHTRLYEQHDKAGKTLKEQSFLIQTQQLQSAEGATYCKFRQLKKFTRYLLHNWKDYLSG